MEVEVLILIKLSLKSLPELFVNNKVEVSLINSFIYN